MGYTHYFPATKAPTPLQWSAITQAFNRVLQNLPAHSESAGGGYVDHPLVVQYEEDVNDPPEVSAEKIRFNGVDDLAHETFWLEAQPDSSFQFCKTARKPYDLVVCAALILAERHAPGCYKITSDGDAGEWAAALQLVRSSMDRSAIDIQMPPGIQEEDP